jgi:4-amino-4-deoxy-L-arabinose transferase-like glycosyltransferase
VAIGFAFVALVVCVWYFTWPRAFEIDLVETQLYGNSTYQWQKNNNGITTGLQVTWNITMETDNKANWVPTLVNRLDLNIYDHNTGAKFANASTGSFVLGVKERKIVYFITTIDLQQRSTSDQTLQDLTSACYQSSSSPNTGPQYSLNLIYEVTYHISGFIWTYQTQQTDPSFHCPV